MVSRGLLRITGGNWGLLKIMGITGDYWELLDISKYY
jgi:hypothetical protein